MLRVFVFALLVVLSSVQPTNGQEPSKDPLRIMKINVMLRRLAGLPVMQRKNEKSQFEGVLLSYDPEKESAIILVPRKIRLKDLSKKGQQSLLAMDAEVREFEESDKKRLAKIEADKIAEKKNRDSNFDRLLKESGKGAKKTGDFTIAGRPAYLNYSFSGSSGFGSIMQVMVYRSDTNSLDSLAVNEQGSGTDQTRLRLQPGTYYLEINAANCSWAIEVLEAKKK
jgi:hypothetical protein